MTDNPSLEPAELVAAETVLRLVVRNLGGDIIGYAEMKKEPAGSISREEFDHLKHDFAQVRNQMLRLQTQLKLLENRLGHHREL